MAEDSNDCFINSFSSWVNTSTSPASSGILNIWVEFLVIFIPKAGTSYHLSPSFSFIFFFLSQGANLIIVVSWSFLWKATKGILFLNEDKILVEIETPTEDVSNDLNNSDKT